MKIKKLKLNAQSIDQQKTFFINKLGFELKEEHPHSFTFQVGWTELTFVKSDLDLKYHYCFLIPSNQLQSAIKWLQNKTQLVEIESDKIIQHFESWNAHSIYFYDADGNLAEFIVRHDLKNEQEGSFDVSKILCVNEIGMPVRNVESINDKLQTEIQSRFWKGDLKRFGTNGDLDGLFLLVNPDIKNNWFPTDLIVQQAPFQAVIEQDSNHYSLTFNTELPIEIQIESLD